MRRSVRNSLAVLGATVAAYAGLAAAPAHGASCASVEDTLNANKSAVVVTCVPAGAASISTAESTAASGGTTKYSVATLKAEVGQTFSPKTAGYPWAGMIAKNGTAQVGGWAPRRQVIPGGEPPKETKRQALEKELANAVAAAAKAAESVSAHEAAVVAAEEALVAAQAAATNANALVSRIQGELNELPPEESQAEKEAREKAEREAREKAEREAKERAEREAREKAEREQHEKEEREKLEEPPHEEVPGVVFHKGVDGGGWGEANEVNDYKKLGANASVRLENPGNTNYLTSRGYYVVYLLNHYSTSGIKSVNAANYAKEVVSVHNQNPTDAIEVENEPGGNWFWGNGAESAENAAAYDRLLKASHEACPSCVLYASADGGHAGNNAWLRAMLKADPNVPNYVTAFTEHPYDGSGANPEATLVHFGAVEEAHNLTHIFIAITEYGRPLATGTGDSPKSTEAQQAKADGAMTKKARSVGYVLNYEAYGYRGDGSPEYAIFKADGTPRPAVAAIAGG